MASKLLWDSSRRCSVNSMLWGLFCLCLIPNLSLKPVVLHSIYVFMILQFITAVQIRGYLSIT